MHITFFFDFALFDSNDRLIFVEQLRHLLLGQLDCVILKLDIDPGAAVLCLIQEDFAAVVFKVAILFHSAFIYDWRNVTAEAFSGGC